MLTPINYIFFNTNIAIYGVCGLNAVLANFDRFYRPATLWVDIAFYFNNQIDLYDQLQDYSHDKKLYSLLTEFTED